MTAKRAQKTSSLKADPTPRQRSVARCVSPAAQRFELLQGSMPIPLEQIDRHPLNPRREFGDLDHLAESLRQGQLQEIVVRQAGDRYQLIAGERRLRAAQLGKLPTLRANVVACDDATALELLGRENLEREQFNAIEEAGWLLQMLEATGLSQRQLSDHLKTSMQLPEGREMSQGFIGNRLRLLHLPDKWRERVARGVLPESHARDLAKWADRPNVLKQLDQLFSGKELRNDDSRKQLGLTVREWQSEISQAVRSVTRPASPGGWHRLPEGYGEVLIARATFTKHAAELDIVEVIDGRGGKFRRAFNCDLWDELQKAARDRQRQKAQEKAEKAAAVKTNGAPDPRAVERRREQRNKALYRYKIEWLQRAIVDQLPDKVLRGLPATGTNAGPVAALLRLLLHLAASKASTNPAWDCGSPLRLAIRRAGGTARHKEPLDDLQELVDPGDVLTVACDLATVWISKPVKGSSGVLDHDEIETFAASIGIDFARDWRPDDHFFAVLTGEELDQLEKDWKQTTKGTKRDRIKALRAAIGDAPVFPKLLARLKPCGIRY